MKFKLEPPLPTGYNLPDARLDMPALLTPGMKPVGPVKIDWSHPLARGLYVALIYTSSHRFDLVAGRKHTNTQVISYEGSNFTGEISGASFLASLRITPAHSVFTKIRFGENNGTSRQYLMSYGNNAIADSLNIWLDGDSHSVNPGKLSVSTGAVPRISTGTFYPTYNGKSFGYTATGASGGVVMYSKDGVIPSVDANSSWSSTPNARAVYIGMSYAADNYIRSGAISYMYIYNRTLLPTEAVSINTDPYQFLIPA